MWNIHEHPPFANHVENPGFPGFPMGFPHQLAGSLRRFRGTFPAAAQWTREAPLLRLLAGHQRSSDIKWKTHENIGSGRSGNPFCLTLVWSNLMILVW